jgi:hypothetical protein
MHSQTEGNKGEKTADERRLTQMLRHQQKILVGLLFVIPVQSVQKTPGKIPGVGTIQTRTETRTEI